MVAAHTPAVLAIADQVVTLAAGRIVATEDRAANDAEDREPVRMAVGGMAG